MISRKSDPVDDQQKAGVYDITLILRIKILSMLQNEYMCDTVNPPAQADGFGDYVIIPEVINILC